jgi:hypothetical protein
MNKYFRFSGTTFHKLEELGVRASAVLRRAGLAQGLIDEPRVLLTTKELFALWRAVGEVSTNPRLVSSSERKAKPNDSTPSLSLLFRQRISAQL